MTIVYQQPSGIGTCVLSLIAPIRSYVKSEEWQDYYS